ncbi:hypothetical protein BH18ACT4_BH18ACT4_06360 [soil metagenome]
MRRAACQGRTRLFFPPRAERPQARVRREAKARAICAACPVLEMCRLYARAHHEYGFWGGESEGERTGIGPEVSSAGDGRPRRHLALQPAPVSGAVWGTTAGTGIHHLE